MDSENNDNQMPESTPEAEATPAETAPAEPAYDSAEELKNLTAELENYQAEEAAKEAAAAESTPEPTAETSSESVPEPTMDSAPTDSLAEPVEEPKLEAPATLDPASIDPTPEPELTPAPEEPTPEPESDPGHHVADFTNQPAPEEPKSEEEEKADDAPLKPAAPVPGSIGSAKSYDPNTANKPPKKKLSTTTLLVIVLIVVCAVVAIIVIVSMIMSQPKATPTVTNSTGETNQPVRESTSSTLTCTREFGEEDLLSLGNEATAATDRIIASYTDDELDEFGETLTVTYSSATAARAGATALRDSYDATVTRAGLAADPFDSSYPRADSVVTVTHVADAEDFDEDSATIFDLKVSDGIVDTSAKAIQTIYDAKGFSCTIK